MPTTDELVFVGHATTRIRLDGTTVLTDPLLRNWLGPLHRQSAPPEPGTGADADAILISHAHQDHLDLRSLRRLPGSRPLVVPRGAGRIASRGNRFEVVELSVGEQTSVGGLKITAVPAKHEGGRFPFHRRDPDPIGFLIESPSRRVYFAGDTDLFDEMATLRPIDLALLPVWGWGPNVGPGHLDPASAADALELIQPSTAVPIHWGTLYPTLLRRFRPRFLIDPPHEFARRASEVAPDVDVRVLQPGEALQLDHPPEPGDESR